MNYLGILIFPTHFSKVLYQFLHSTKKIQDGNEITYITLNTLNSAFRKIK
jgi:hypothetical protein